MLGKRGVFLNHKRAVVQQAEEIIENYIKQQAELSGRFRFKKTKSKRKIPAGIFLLLAFGLSIGLWILLLVLVF